jgi:carbon-monoxide dehydrogenase small subunit
MMPVKIAVNGRLVSAETAPRTHLADFIRDQVGLTGTHLGCEHGVCGACVVLVDGQPVRSCITFAVACEGRSVTTIEGYGEDPLMARLRESFTIHHALQCGYCTPGMLATARDIVLRLPEADERRIRAELSGNICRCTGYQGIVNAVLAVLSDLRRSPDPAIVALQADAARERSALMPASSIPPASPAPLARAEGVAQPASASVAQAPAVIPAASSQPGSTVSPAREASVRDPGGTVISEQFDLPFPVEAVWALMSDPARVAACLPGAFVTAQEGDQVKGGVALQFGPMKAKFEGEAQLSIDSLGRSARLKGRGRDRLTQSRAEGEIDWQVSSTGSGASRVAIQMRYTLQGPFAQFSRGGLVQEFVRRIVQQFAANVTGVLGGAHPNAAAGPSASSGPDETGAPPVASTINPLALLWHVLWSRIRRMFGGRH